MKGIVFTEFIDLVEEKFGFAVTDQMIEGSALPSGGAYTAIGSYDQQELVQLVAQLKQVTGAPESDLLQMFGRHLFDRFAGRYPEVLADAVDCFGFLMQLSRYLGDTLHWLNPEAELPCLEIKQSEAGAVILCYCSNGQLSDLAEGLLHGCAAHFHESIVVRREKLESETDPRVCFHLAQPVLTSGAAV